MKKIIVTGCNGQLGRAVNLEYAGSTEYELVNTDVGELDITKVDEVMKFVREVKPYAIINCAAYTAVEACEKEEDLAFRINAVGARNLSIAANETGAKLMHISTDYVFSGAGERFYEPEDPTGPLGVYGETKRNGELAVRELLERFFIVRISWVFGKNGKNFVRTMLGLAETRAEVNVVCDQIGSPTYTADLAPLLCDMIATDQYGVYHATNEGVCSWAEFAREIFRLAGKNVRVNAISTSEYPARAVRPMNSRMNKDKLERMGFFRLPAWQDALERYLREIENE